MPLPQPGSPLPLAIPSPTLHGTVGRVPRQQICEVRGLRTTCPSWSYLRAVGSCAECDFERCRAAVSTGFCIAVGAVAGRGVAGASCAATRAVARVAGVAAGGVSGFFGGGGALEGFGDGFGGQGSGGVVEGCGAEQEFGVADLE